MKAQQEFEKRMYDLILDQLDTRKPTLWCPRCERHTYGGCEKCVLTGSGAMSPEGIIIKVEKENNE